MFLENLETALEMKQNLFFTGKKITPKLIVVPSLKFMFFVRNIIKYYKNIFEHVSGSFRDST